MFAGPSMAAFLLFVIIPFFYGIYLTMTNWDGIAATKTFVGIQNYIALFHDTEFWGSILLTFKYVIAVVSLTNVIAFLLAVLLTSGIRGESFLRAGFFTPNLIGGIVLGFIWQFIFNRVLTTLPVFPEKSMLGGEISAFWAMVIVQVWKESGYMLLIYIAGLVGVSQDYIEAAKIDGAGDWTILLNVVIPLIKPTLAVLVLYYVVQHWNSWFNAMIYLQSREKYPLQLFLREILVSGTSNSAASQGFDMTELDQYKQLVKYCTTILATAPILCIYPFLQKYFVKGVLIGSVKE